jgi:hypothetical protein
MNKNKSRFPTDQATIRQAYSAVHDLANDLRNRLSNAVKEAKSRCLAPARHMGSVLKYLTKFSDAEVQSTLEVPGDLVIDANAVIGLRHLDVDLLRDATGSWAATVGKLEPYDGQPFPRKPIRLRGQRSKQAAVPHDNEAKLLQEGDALHRLGTGICPN